jgi:hypothetical protein
MGGAESREYGFRDGAGPWVFSSDGATMVCGEVMETVTQRPRRPFHHLRQDELRTNWGPDIAPGLYTSITRLVAWPACIVEEHDGLYVGGTPGVDIAHVVTRSGTA